MKSLLLAIVLLLSSFLPAMAQTATPSASSILGLYDEEFDSTNSASLSATPTPTATPSARTTTYIDPTDAPVSGNVETSLIILMAGLGFILLGINYSRRSL